MFLSHCVTAHSMTQPHAWQSRYGWIYFAHIWRGDDCVITGGPGSGKGTQCQTVVARMGFVAIALSRWTRWWIDEWIVHIVSHSAEKIFNFQLHSLVQWRPAAKWGVIQYPVTDDKLYFKFSWNENVCYCASGAVWKPTRIADFSADGDRRACAHYHRPPPPNWGYGDDFKVEVLDDHNFSGWKDLWRQSKGVSAWCFSLQPRSGQTCLYMAKISK